MAIKIPKQVMQNASKQAIKLLKPNIEDAVSKRVEELKQQMISEFMNHPVTEEIMTGYNAKNTSNTLGGKGNLFSFIGFEFDDAPIIPIVELLEKTNVVFGPIRQDIIVANITIPSAQDIFKKTPMPWASGRSWAKGIESGISGLGYYIQVYNKGRSEGGFQNESKMRGGKFENIKYISTLINKYKELFSKINNAQINIKSL
jgi:hypothetical protein